MRIWSWIPAIGLLAGVWAAVGADDDYERLRRQMVNEIAAVAAAASNESGKPVIDARVMAVMSKIPRHLFVPSNLERNAYENRPLPIGYGQSISQPYIVALMTDLMNVKPNDAVLEIGTGTGYQAAILSNLTRNVYTIEIIEPLAKEAQSRLNKMGYNELHARTGDGYYGWEAHAPYDSIVVTAAASHVPPPLIKQLKPGGRMVIPVGAPFLTQYLMLVEKKADATISTKQILPVRFVPLIVSRQESAQL